MKNCKRNAVSIHRLVAKHFIDGYREDLVINHINGNKHDNIVTNLEVCTQKENLNHKNNYKRKTPNNAKNVFCFRSGIYYDSIYKASLARNINYNTLMFMLSRFESYKDLQKI